MVRPRVRLKAVDLALTLVEVSASARKRVRHHAVPKCPQQVKLGTERLYFLPFEGFAAPVPTASVHESPRLARVKSPTFSAIGCT